jgi:hypothetical protein
LAAAEATTMVEAMKARETVLIAQANQGGLDGDVRAGALGEATRLRQGKVTGQPGAPQEAGIDAISTAFPDCVIRRARHLRAAVGLGLAKASCCWRSCCWSCRR